MSRIFTQFFSSGSTNATLGKGKVFHYGNQNVCFVSELTGKRNACVRTGSAQKVLGILLVEIPFRCFIGYGLASSNHKRHMLLTRVDKRHDFQNQT